MTTSSPELIVHWWLAFISDVKTYHYMLILRMKLISSLQCRLVLCFLILEKKVVFHMRWGSGDKNALYRTLQLLMQVSSFVIFENTSKSVMLNWNFAVSSIFVLVFCLGACPEMFISKLFFKDCFLRLVNIKKGNTILASNYIFTLRNSLIKEQGEKI